MEQYDYNKMTLRQELEARFNEAENLMKKIIPATQLIYAAKSTALTNNRIKTLVKEKPSGYMYNDKNAHALMSCNASQHGTVARAAIGVLGALRESIQQQNGSNTKEESLNDMRANMWGWKYGYDNPRGNCEELIEQRYPKYIKR